MYVDIRWYSVVVLQRRSSSSALFQQRASVVSLCLVLSSCRRSLPVDVCDSKLAFARRWFITSAGVGLRMDRRLTDVLTTLGMKSISVNCIGATLRPDARRSTSGVRWLLANYRSEPSTSKHAMSVITGS